ncbi:MAG: hypothetical protein ABI415_01515, partial [Flavitalea sp.]
NTIIYYSYKRAMKSNDHANHRLNWLHPFVNVPPLAIGHRNLTAKESVKNKIKMICTMGHSARSFKEFVAMLYSFSIDLIADVRIFSGTVTLSIT